MKKNNGFTLIELLATIIILAGIALVAFPILLNTIKDSEEKIDKTTEKIVENAAKLYVDNNANDYPKTNGNTYCVGFDDLISSKHLEKGLLEAADVDYSNKVVKVTVTDNYDYEIVNSNECQPIIKICQAATEKTKTIGNVPRGNYEAGDEYLCEVKPGLIHTFFVLSTEDENINLLMDSSIDKNGNAITDYNHFEYNSITETYNNEEDFTRWSYGNTTVNGPTAAFEFLYNATKDWINVPNMIMDYEDEGNNYQSIKTENGITTITSGDDNTFTIGNSAAPLKARMPKLIEVEEVGCAAVNATEDSNCSLNLGHGQNSCPYWAYNYNNESYCGYTTKNVVNNNFDYWTLASFDLNDNTIWNGNYLISLENRPYLARTIGYDGDISTYGVYAEQLITVRPVITIHKDEL